MLENVLRHRDVENVFIFQTPGMMQRPVAAWAYDAIRERSGLLESGAYMWGQLMNLDQLRESLDYVASASFGRADRNGRHKRPTIAQDYIPQGQALAADTNAAPYSAQSADASKLAYLQRLAALCRERKLNCVYVHGPVAEPVCRGSDAYLDRVAEMIARTGLPVAASRPVCISPSEYGDTLEHVAPAAKRKYTRIYAELLAPYLRRPAQ